MTFSKGTALAWLVVTLMPFSASGFLMRDGEGPEPILVQIKQSLRLSPDLETQLQALASVEANLGLSVLKRFVGPTYLELVAFPRDFTEAQALEAIANLQQLAAVQQVVAVSASNLIFRSGDFGTEFLPGEPIPEALLRGIDSGPTAPVDPSVVRSPHVPNQLIVSWKPEYLWNATQTGFLDQIAAFNRSAGCRVISETTFSQIDLTQILAWSGSDRLLLSKLQRYTNSGWVRYAQPNFLFSINAPGDDSLGVQPAPRSRPQRQSEFKRPRANWNDE